MALAFDGIRIVDFTQVLAGPFATQQLAQLGAEVIKIEQPDGGDITRGPPPGDISPSFITCNLGKKSITLNLKSADAREIVHKLVETADVVVENFKPGVMQRLGFDYETLKTIKPDLVYCSISGYGQTGPKAPLAAFDGAIQASSGMMAVSGHPETGPARAGYFAVDMSTALHAAFTIAAALHRKQVTGLGQRLDVAMMDTAMLMLAPQMSAYLMNGTVPELLGNQSPTRQPTANIFPTADGRLQVIALRETQVQNLFAVIGMPERYAEFDEPKVRLKRSAEIHELVSTVLQTQSTAHWLAALLKVNVPVSEVRELADVVIDDQFAHRNAFVEIASPKDGEETTRVVFAGYTASADGPTLQRSAPRLGEHNEAVLSELGYTPESITLLREQGTIS